MGPPKCPGRILSKKTQPSEISHAESEKLSGTSCWTSHWHNLSDHSFDTPTLFLCSWAWLSDWLRPSLPAEDDRHRPASSRPALAKHTKMAVVEPRKALVDKA